MSRKTARRGVVICGAYGMENAGDDAVLTAILAALRGIDSTLPVTVMARRPRETAKRFGAAAIHPLRVLRWAAACRRAELFISGGGSLLQDVTSRRSLWYYLAAIRLAKACGCAVQLYGCGVGPLLRERSRHMTAAVLNACADVITVRDADSLALLEALRNAEPPGAVLSDSHAGMSQKEPSPMTHVLLAADPALSLPPVRGEREPKLGVVLRQWPGFDEAAPALAAAVRYAAETWRLAPVFLCLGPGDRLAAETVCAQLGDIPCSFSVDARRAGRMSLVLSMRLHGLIFALNGGAPAAGLSYDPKVASFCREAGLPCLPFEGAGAEELIRLLDEAAHLDAERLSAAAEALRRRERVNAYAAAELLTGEEDRA